MQARNENVRSWWNQQVCGTQFPESEKSTRAYLAEIGKVRYRLEPYIHSFAEFTRYHGKKKLGVCVGAGSDFVEWVRAGALAYGVDLTAAAIAHTRRRLELEGLQAVDLRQADVEHLDYPDDSFDRVYSWGVIHHTPDPLRALSEIVRVTKPQGEVKVMICHHSPVAAFVTWLRCCALRGRPWHSISYAVADYVESPGTRAYTRHETRAMLEPLPLEDITVHTVLTWCDLAAKSRSSLLRGVHRLLATLCGGSRVGWFKLINARKRA